MLSPDGSKLEIWDIYFGLVVLYVIFEIPLRIVGITENSKILSIIDYFVIAIFVIDIIIKFNLAYHDHEKLILVTDRWLIAKKYLAFWFWMDVAATLPYGKIEESLYGEKDSNAYKVTKFLHLLRYVKVFKAISNLKSQSKKLGLYHMVTTEFIVLLMQTIYAAHLFGCFWFYMSTKDVNIDLKNQTWLNTFGYENEDNTTKYIASLYWSVATLLSIGYGDIYPTNIGERIYSIVVMIIGSLLIGIIIDRIRYYFENNDLLMKLIFTKEYEFITNLNGRKIPRSLEQKLKVSYHVLYCCLFYLISSS